MKLWGGRFEGGPDPAMEAFGRSLHCDGRLALYDVRACRAHVRMLVEVGVLATGRVEEALGPADYADPTLEAWKLEAGRTSPPPSPR